MPLDEYELLQIGLRIAAAVGVFLVGRWLARKARTALGKALEKASIAPSMSRLLLLAAYYGIMLVVIISSLALIGFPIQALLTASLVIVVILGIALQQSISNLAATIVFMLFQPFRVGEVIEANDVQGTVKEIQLFSTVLVTGDNKEITIPNAEIQGNNLINYTRLGQLRVDFVFQVSYGDDLPQVKAILGEVLAADERVLAEPAPVTFVQSLDDSGVSVAVRPWVKSEDYWTLQWDLPERIKLRFDAEGITMPFPQRDVYLHGGSAPKNDRDKS
jgi:small conductance mechanosensitive channel